MKGILRMGILSALMSLVGGGFAWIYPATHATIMDDNAMKNAMQFASMLDKPQLDKAQAKGRSNFEQYFEPNEDVVESILQSRGG